MYQHLIVWEDIQLVIYMSTYERIKFIKFCCQIYKSIDKSSCGWWSWGDW